MHLNQHKFLTSNARPITMVLHYCTCMVLLVLAVLYTNPAQATIIEQQHFSTVTLSISASTANVEQTCKHCSSHHQDNKLNYCYSDICCPACSILGFTQALQQKTSKQQVNSSYLLRLSHFPLRPDTPPPKLINV